MGKGSPAGVDGRRGPSEPSVALERRDGGVLLRATGDWTVTSSRRLDALLARLSPEGERATFDLSEVSAFDSTGAWLVQRTLAELRRRDFEVDVTGLPPAQTALLRAVEDKAPKEAIGGRPRTSPLDSLAALGEASERLMRDAVAFVAFLGEACLVQGRVFLQPRRLRLTSWVLHMQRHGLDALPIIALISFLIGIVLSYQAAVQLRDFGADVFVVDLVGLSVLREIGILLAAIVVAGRSGSAFTAQLGSMKLNEEVDALRTMGMGPLEVLVLPRVWALLLTLPILAFLADLFGLIGGGLMCWGVLDIAPRAFVERLREAVDPWSFWVGLIKAPFFGVVIALVGCFEGLRVEGSAESLGSHTTKAVVEAIFLVIVLDAVFSIFFNLVGV